MEGPHDDNLDWDKPTEFFDILPNTRYRVTHNRLGTFVLAVSSTQWHDDDDDGVVCGTIVEGEATLRDERLPVGAAVRAKWSNITAFAAV